MNISCGELVAERCRWQTHVSLKIQEFGKREKVFPLEHLHFAEKSKQDGKADLFYRNYFSSRIIT